MKIGIDARPLQGETRYRGIGKALEFLLEELVKQLEPADRCVFYVDANLPLPPTLDIFPKKRLIRIAGSKLGTTRYIRSIVPAHRVIKPRKSDIDVLLQYDVTLGIPTNVPTVSMFHDLIPLLFRDVEKKQVASSLRKLKNRSAQAVYWRRYLRILKRYQRASKLLPISKSSQKDLLRYIPGIKPKSVEVLYLAVRPKQASKNTSKTAQKLISRPFLLYVGGIDTRKNIAGLVDAFYELKPSHPDLRLIAVGKEFGLQDQLANVGWTTAVAKNPDFAKDIVTPGFVADEDLLQLYAHAHAFVFPSRYEGFGLPVLEAMGAGCPVIAYDNSSIPEVAGDAALLVHDGDSLVPAIEKVLSSAKLRKELIAKGKKQATKFTWEETARRTLEVLRETAKN